MSEFVKKIIPRDDLTIKDLQKRSRFEMFVVLTEGIVTWFPHQKRSFCYRGDKFTSDEARMLANLVRILINKGIDKFKTVIFYDNDYHFQNDNRTIVKITAGVVEKNLLEKYKKALTRVPMPEYLK